MLVLFPASEEGNLAETERANRHVTGCELESQKRSVAFGSERRECAAPTLSADWRELPRAAAAD